MIRLLPLSLLVLALAVHQGAAAADSKEVQDQRRTAQKERQEKKTERAQAIADATRAFREFVHELNADYRQRVKDLETEFELRRVELKADHDARLASAEADYQQKLSNLFMRPGVVLDDETIRQLQAQGRAYADEKFALEKQSADELHRVRMENEAEKNAIWSERDARAMEKAEALGLTRTYAPILATPIGGGLTKQEERWNEREEKEAARLEERNRKTLQEYRNGRELREWQLANMQEDFELMWQEKAELHALDAEGLMFNAIFMQAAQGGQANQQKLVAQLAEINEKKKLVAIEYRKQRDQERIRRREEKRAITEK